jgi:type IV pilus biogenesis protein CpaD/CtpE
VKTSPLSRHKSRENYTSRITALSLLAILLALLLTGCKNEPKSSTAADPAGVYTLVSVDGKNVPCEMMHGTTAMTVKSGAFTISTNSTCTSLVTFSVPQGSDVSREVKASYTQQGAELTLQWEGAGITQGQIKGNQFTMTNEGMVFSYRKE